MNWKKWKNVLQSCSIMAWNACLWCNASKVKLHGNNRFCFGREMLTCTGTPRSVVKGPCGLHLMLAKQNINYFSNSLCPNIVHTCCSLAQQSSTKGHEVAAHCRVQLLQCKLNSAHVDCRPVTFGLSSRRRRTSEKSALLLLPSRVKRGDTLRQCERLHTIRNCDAMIWLHQNPSLSSNEELRFFSSGT